MIKMRLVTLLLLIFLVCSAKGLSDAQFEELRAPLSRMRINDGPEVGGEQDDIKSVLMIMRNDWERVSESLPKLEPRYVSGLLGIAMDSMHEFEYLGFTIAMLHEVQKGSVQNQLNIYELLVPSYAKEHFCALNYKEPSLRKALTDVRLYFKNKGDDENVRQIDRILHGEAKDSCDRFREENLLEPLPTLEELWLTGRKDRDGWTKAMAKSARDARNKKLLPYDPRRLFDFTFSDIILLLCGLVFFGILVFWFWPKKLKKIQAPVC
jgi:hypothetical protein